MKKVKIIGNIATILALLLIGYRILHYDVDWRNLFRIDKLGTISLCILACAILIWLNHLPWMKLVKIFSGSGKTLDVHHIDFLTVYVKSNVFKYIPGNVFQYVGRNEIAFRLGLNHVDVATSTFVEVILTALAAFISAFVLVGSYAWNYLTTHWVIFAAIIIVAVLALTILLLLAHRKRGKLKEYLARYKSILSNQSSVSGLLGCFIFYILTLFYSGAVFFVVIRLCGGVEISLSGFRLIMGAYILAWVAGYVTPGSPGGIGIRELIMISVISGSGIIPEVAVTSASVVYRIITILGDVLAFVLVFLYSKFRKVKNSQI